VSAVFVALKVAHLVAVVIGFGPLFVYPVMIRRSGDSVEVIRSMRIARSNISEPAFLLVGPLGLLTAWQHPDEGVLTRLWVQLAIPLWLFAVVVVWCVQRPLAKRVAASAELVAAGDGSVNAVLRRRITWLTRVTWVSWAGLVGMLLLMVMQPA
jgi:Predicted integral membrane protein (DUF2269)